jgi:hypothetical protein
MRRYVCRCYSWRYLKRKLFSSIYSTAVTIGITILLFSNFYAFQYSGTSSESIATRVHTSHENIDKPASTSLSDGGRRQQHFFECLSPKSSLPACLPFPEARGEAVLSKEEWRIHLHEVLEATENLRKYPVSEYGGSKGPWIENVWIDGLLPYLDDFYPLVPLFVQWTDMAFGKEWASGRPAGGSVFDRAWSWPTSVEYNETSKSFSRIPLQPTVEPFRLRRDVIYITVVQHDHGTPDFAPFNAHSCDHYRNVLILGAGGWGAASVPLLFPDVEPLQLSTRAASPRVFVTTFTGTLHLGRGAMADGVHQSTLPKRLFSITSGDWRGNSAKSIFVLAPRGCGRTSFRLYETFQYGSVMIYTYDDIPWIPYADYTQWRDPAAKKDPSRMAPVEADGIWGPNGVGFVVSYSELPTFFCVACKFLEPGSAKKFIGKPFVLDENASCDCTSEVWDKMFPEDNSGIVIPPDSVIATMETRLHRISKQLFTLNGTVDQIRKFVREEKDSKLVCVPKPETYGACA